MKLKQALKCRLTRKELLLVPSSFDVVGSIAVFNDFPKELGKKEKIVADALMSLNPSIKTVAKKSGKYSGRLRTPKITIISGAKTKETVHKENNCILRLNIEKCYFSTRLANERLRIAKQVKNGEEVLVLFSGVAAYQCVIAKNSNPKTVYGIELNKTAHKYAEENIKINKLNNITLLQGDVKKILPKLNKKFDRIIMPLPTNAKYYLGLALNKINKNGIINFYDFQKENEFDN